MRYTIAELMERIIKALHYPGRLHDLSFDDPRAIRFTYFGKRYVVSLYTGMVEISEGFVLLTNEETRSLERRMQML